MSESNNQVPEAFWDRVDEAIALVNQQVEKSTVEDVSASVLYAAARFNAFNVAGTTATKDELAQEKEAAVKFYVEQYTAMLEENLQDYVDNYEFYTTDDQAEN